jgi:hypothetical protein
MPWRTGLLVLTLCGICCSPPASCTDVYIGSLYDDVGGGGGIGVGGGSVSSGGGGDTCQGTCEPAPFTQLAGLPFVLLGRVPTDQEPPPCPAVAPQDGVTGYTDMSGTAPAECAPCTCQPPKGSCALPTALAAYYSHPAECPAPMETPSKPFTAPDGWDGSCTTYDAIPGDPICSGSNCIQSLMIPPLGVTDPPTCEPELPPPPKIEKAEWGNSGTVCSRPSVQGSCRSPTVEICAPTAPPGWLTCLRRDGADLPCYEPWADKHVFYTDSTIKDTRGCAACTCGAPVGSKCSTSVSVYTDDCCGCNDPGAPTLVTLGVDSMGASCGDIKPSGSALVSKEATPPVYQPGQCAPSGQPDHNDPIGAVTGVNSLPDTAYTLCCRSYEVPR